MAISRVQVKAGAQDSPSATPTAAFDAATTSGNLLVLTVAADDYAASPPTGWTQSTGCGQQTFLGHYLWWRVSNGLTSVQYTLGSATTSCWVLVEYAGTAASPYDVSAGQFAQSSAATYTTPAVTPTTGERLVLATVGGSNGVGSWPSGASLDTWLNSFTEVGEAANTLGSGTRDLVGLAERFVTGSGSTTFSSGATYGTRDPEARTGITIAFKAASTGATAAPAGRRVLTSALLDM